MNKERKIIMMKKHNNMPTEENKAMIIAALKVAIEGCEELIEELQTNGFTDKTIFLENKASEALYHGVTCNLYRIMGAIKDREKAGQRLN